MADDTQPSNNDNRVRISLPVKAVERWLYWVLLTAMAGAHGYNFLTRANAQSTPPELQVRVQQLELSRATDEANIQAMRGNLSDIKTDINRLEGEVLQALGSASNHGRKPIT